MELDKSSAAPFSGLQCGPSLDSTGGVASKVHLPHMKVFATAVLCLAAELRPLARTPCGFPLVVLDVSEARVEHQVCQSIALISAASYVPRGPMQSCGSVTRTPRLACGWCTRAVRACSPFSLDLGLSNSTMVIDFSQRLLSVLRRRRCAGRHAERTLKCAKLEVAESRDSRFRFHAAARFLAGAAVE